MSTSAARASTLKRLAAAIEKRRAEVGIGVAALADAAKVDVSQMVKVLRGQCGLSIESLGRVAAALDVSSADLLGTPKRPAA